VFVQRFGAVLTSFVLAGAGGAALALAGTPSLPLRPLADSSPSSPDGYEHVLVTAPSGLPQSLVDHPDVVQTSQVDAQTWRVTGRLPAPTVTQLTGLSTRDDMQLRSTGYSDTYWNLMWALENRGGAVGQHPAIEDADVDGIEAHTRSTGAGVTVAIVDSGVQPNHPDLPALWRNTDEQCGNGVDDDRNGYVDDCTGWDFVHRDNTPYDSADDNDHGTHIAGTIAAIPNNGRGTAGLAPDVTLMSLKITANGSIWLSDAAQAIRYAADNGADIINGSFGSSPGAPRAGAAVLEDAVNYARSKGVLVVVAAGNDAVNIDQQPVWPASLTQDNVITVGASTAIERIAGFSNTGAVGVDLFAPGHYIASTVDGSAYAAMQGTSMATPHVVAAAALVLAAEPTLSPSEIKSRLMTESDPFSVYEGKSVNGGRLNADHAVAPAGIKLDASSFHDFVAGQPHTASVTASAPRSLFPAGARVDLVGTLLSTVDGQVYGVVEQPLTIDSTATATDANARVPLGPTGIDPASSVLTQDGVRVSLGMTLPAGEYALVVDVVAAENHEHAYGNSSAVFFTVTEPGAPPAPPATAPSPAPEPGTTPPAASIPPVPAPGGSAPAPGPGSGPGSGPAPAPAPAVPGVPAPAPGQGSAPAPAPAAPVPGAPAPGAPAPAAPAPAAPAPGGGGAPAPAAPAPAAPAPAAPAPAAPAPAAPAPAAPAPAAPAPGGGAPAPAAPAPAAPAPGGGAAPAPVPAPTPTAPPTPVTDDGITITSVSPANGPATGGTRIMIMGANFPQNPVVSIGGAWVYVSSATSMTISVTTPGGVPGTAVDVLVGDRSGRTVTMARAFRYDAAAQAPTTEPGTSNPEPGPAAPSPGQNPTTPTPGQNPTTDPGTTNPGSNPTPGTTAPSVPAGPAGTTYRPLPQFGQPTERAGLRLAPLTGRNPLSSVGSWTRWRCVDVRCAGVPVR